MFWIVIGVIVFFTIIGIIIDCNVEDVFFGIIGMVVFIIAISLGLIFLTPTYIESKSIDDKIMVVQEANEELECDIANSVSSYMKYENKTFSEIKPDYNNMDLIAFAETYPALQSSTLIQEQITTYKENKEQIVNLKQRKIETNNSLKYWLFIKE